MIFNHSPVGHSSALVSACSAAIACSHTVAGWLSLSQTTALLQSVAAVVATVSGVLSIVSFIVHKFKTKSQP